MGNGTGPVPRSRRPVTQHDAAFPYRHVHIPVRHEHDETALSFHDNAAARSMKACRDISRLADHDLDDGMYPIFALNLRAEIVMGGNDNRIGEKVKENGGDRRHRPEIPLMGTHHASDMGRDSGSVQSPQAM